jgi:hypothetical protein
MDDIAIDPALYGATYGDSTLPAPAPSVDGATIVPSTQSDFNVAGAPSAGSNNVLAGIAAAVTGIASAGMQIAQLPSNLKTQQTIADTQNRVAVLGAQTQLAQATAAYNRAAGLASSPSFVVILAIAGLALAAMQLVKRKG